MKNFFNYLALYVLCLCFLSACEREPFPAYSGQGKKPMYVPISELGEIKSLPPQDIGQTGTIFLLDSLFFMLEFKKGIHVFNLKDTNNTVSLAFLQVPAITDFTISGTRLYADSWRDLVTIDISNLYQIKEISRSKGVFEPILYPPLYNGIFECVDESKGVLIGWKDELLVDAKCFTN